MIEQPLEALASISEQANIFGKVLDELVAPTGGITKVMANTRHLWEEVFGAAVDDAPRVLICFNAERSRGAENQRNDLHRVDRDWIVVVMRGHGFRNKMAKDDEGGGIAQTDDFYTMCETIRDKIRTVLSGVGEFPLDYRGMRPLPGVAVPNQANVFLDAYQIDFSTANDIPGIALAAPVQP